ncbi:Extradiol aromatic ring-opening dioxygenase [Suhomyces tanzawaensis NRRL Y-17324]|uniref:Extradiol aromatic ring-opening dioxygenase n=1 Tax=Suhomyces tanzawaensis NRRL Y-17324 TaxID=984487 RepID=A0A1E4SRR7_9ASCO|nr:Extradiol aromatic ring-opening dioxygenase [Suhomyces tanzawaensis NRRL Y-17324]ODV82102.1 Extradiol aromatic ring-opening dioxygenase [Suhomyces tanzawaensis NRRL Y-17324]
MPAKFTVNPQPFPNYFVSHGGPTFMYGQSNGDVGAYKHLQQLGAQIKAWKPDYIVVLSAHWQSSAPNLIEVATVADQEENPLIYDFYGFPKYMYQEEFHTKNLRSVGELIASQLQTAGFDSKLTKRGLDHGVWVPFKAAFTNYNTMTQEKYSGGLDLPDTALIQVSLPYDDTDFKTAYKLGQAIDKFRSHLVWDDASQCYLKGLVIFSGMSVHNLRELGSPYAEPYSRQFNELLRQIFANNTHLLLLLERIKHDHTKLLYRAHPTLEHFLPLVIGSGSAGKEGVKELYNSESGSLGWGIYQF